MSARKRPRTGDAAGPASPSTPPASSSRSVATMFKQQMVRQQSDEAIDCPGCSRRIPLALINAHLDRNCLSSPDPTTKSPATAAATPSSPAPAAHSSSRSFLPIPLQRRTGAEPSASLVQPERLDFAEEDEKDDDDKETNVRPLADEKYYERHFSVILNTALRLYRRLFDATELALLGGFERMGMDTRRLLIRLSQRQARWFRVPQLRYSEISSIPEAVAELQAAGWCIGEVQLTGIDEALPLLSVAELRQLCRELRVTAGSSKDATVLAVKQHLASQSVLVGSPRKSTIRKVLKLTGSIVGLAAFAKQLLKRLELLFFANTSMEERTMTTMVLVEKDVLVYPKYAIVRSQPLFVDREHLLSFEAAIAAEAEFLELCEELAMGASESSRTAATGRWPRKSNRLQSFATEDDEIDESFSMALQSAAAREAAYAACKRIIDLWHDCMATTTASPSPASYFLQRFTAAWVYTRCASMVAPVLERLRRHDEAVQLFRQLLGQLDCCRGQRGYWWDRLALNVEYHLKERDSATVICEEALMDPEVKTGYRFAISKRLRRLTSGKRAPPGQQAQHVTIKGRQISISSISMGVQYVGCDGSICRVEEIALQYYLRLDPSNALSATLDDQHVPVETGWKGLHAENGIVTTLFGLLFWDVLFSAQVDVFQTEFQIAPLDLITDAFSLTRSDQIKQRLLLIENGGAQDLLRAVDGAHRGEMCVGVNWSSYSLETLLEISECLGSPVLACICRLLAEDYRHRCSGMPDLILWHPAWKRSRFVEVKSTNDRLSDKQEVWLEALAEHGVDVQVCHVDSAKRFESTTVFTPDTCVLAATSAATSSSTDAASLAGVLKSLFPAHDDDDGEDDAATSHVAMANGSSSSSSGSVELPLVGHRFGCDGSSSSSSSSSSAAAAHHACCDLLVADRTVVVVREHTNVVDANAIQVLDELTQRHLGHLSRKIAVTLAPLMDQACIQVTGYVKRANSRGVAVLSLLIQRSTVV